MAEVRLRRWRLKDADDVAVMIDDEHLRRWSAMIVPSGGSRFAGPSALQRRFGATPSTRLTARRGS